MNLNEFLEFIEINKIEITAKNGKLSVRGKSQLIKDQEVLAHLRQYKQELIELIESGTLCSPKKAALSSAPSIPPDCDQITPEMLPLVKLTQEDINRIAEKIPGGMRGIQDIYPLAPLQEGILFHHMMCAQGDPYILWSQFAFEHRQQLDDFIRAFAWVIDRHDILRTGIFWEGMPEPVQVVARKARLEVTELALDPKDGDISGQLKQRLDSKKYRLDVSVPPLLRVFVARDEPGKRWVAHYLCHHLVADHTTMELLQQEAFAYLMGQGDLLGKPAPYRNYVVQARTGVSREEHETYFRGLLGDVDEPTAPYGLIDVQGDGSDIEDTELMVEEGLATRLRAQARALGVSTASLCHVAWAQVLSQLSGRDDVVFGTVVFGRMDAAEESDRVSGLFINTLPVRIKLDCDTVREAVKNTHAQLSELMRHEHAPLSLAQRCSRVAAPAPLFTALLNCRHSGGSTKLSGELQGVFKGIEALGGEERTNYPITLSVDDYGTGFGLCAQAAGGIDPETICGYMHTALASLSQALEQDPTAKAQALPIMSEAERERILVRYNNTQAGYPQGVCMHELFEAQAKKRPDAIALEYAGAEMSYRELNEQANRLAHYLRSVGAGPDSLVVICAGRCHAMLVGVLGVLKAGGAYVPLDPAYPSERKEYMVKDSRPAAILTAQVSGDIRGLLAAVAGDAVVADLEEDAGLWAGQPAENIDVNSIGLTPRNLAYVIYTSGSTGLPKGVMIEHAGIGNMVEVQRKELGISSESRMLQFASFSFDASVFEIFVTFYQGARLCLLSPDEMIGEKLVESINRAGITHCLIPPVALMSLPEDARFTTMQVLVVGGDASTRAVVKRWGRDCRLLNAYGPTEITVFATLYECSLDDKIDPPIGKTIANARLYILDKNMQPVVHGVAGELYIGGAGIARGYLNRPELTAERFIPDPYQPGARMYKTGDLGRWLQDGNIEFLGRNDFQVKLRGFRIELGEIEARLMEHPGISEAVVQARTDNAGEKRLVAYFIPASGDEKPGAESLRAYLQELLPAYMVPAAYVELEHLPLTPNGKLDRGALPEPDGSSYASRVYEEPQGEAEQALAGIWSGILRMERIGRWDHFFELGGHSLLAVKMVSLIRQEMGIELNLAQVFRKPVLAELAQALQGAEAAKLPPVTRISRDLPLELSYAQQRLWFLAQMQGVSSAYNMPMALRLVGDLDKDALKRAFDHIIVRHESLRTSFVLEGERPIQRIAPDTGGFVLREYDLSTQSSAEEKLKELQEAEARTEFNLEKGPLMRACLVKLGAREHALLITMHHIISDGWSMVVLAKDLVTFYSAGHEGKEAAAAPLAIQYADYAMWQRGWLTGDELKTQSEYWFNALSGAPDLLELPTDRVRPMQQDTSGGFVDIMLDEELTCGLRDLARRHDTTLYMVVLAAFAALLSRLSNQNDVLIGTPVANRRSAELEDVVGFFVNSLVLRVDLSGSPSVSTLLERVKECSLQAQQHQDLPFEQVVEIVKPVRSLSHSPLFQVMFAWNNYSLGELALPGLTFKAQEQAGRIAKFDLMLDLTETETQVGGGLEYATALFDKQTIERFAAYLRNILAVMVAGDQSCVETMDILPPAERQRMLVDWNKPNIDYSQGKCLHELFEEQALAQPGNMAVVQGDTGYSFGELNKKANRLAHYLRTLGISPDQRFAICMQRCPEKLIAVLAVLKAGGAYVPMDPNYPVERLMYMLKDAAPAGVLTHAKVDESLRARMREEGNNLIHLDSDAGLWKELPEDNIVPASIGLKPGNLAYVIYTSGSTGMPKGVMVEHRCISDHCRIIRDYYGLTNTDRMYHFFSFSFDASVEDFFTTLNAGACLVSSTDPLQSPEDFDRFIEEQGISILHLPPLFFHEWISEKKIPAQKALRLINVGGDVLPKQTVELWKNSALRKNGVRFINGYGPTEVTVHTSMYEVPDYIPQNNVPIGRTLPNRSVYILDGHGKLVPTGVSGELYIGGSALARGYLNREDLTEARFLPDPFSKEPGARMYKTGDMARWLPDGNIEFLGRNDFQVKIRGFRIELGEIESRLMEHPGISEAVVDAKQDASGGKRLVAYYVPDRSDASVGAERLRVHLQGMLPDYMIPAAYVELETLPLTPNGKLDRNALPEPDGSSYANREYEEPVGPVEENLARIWADILNLERVGRHDNFFELGGHSLLAVKLINRMRQEGLHADVRDLFTATSLAALADVLDDGSRGISIPGCLIPAGADTITPDMLPLVRLSAGEIELIAGKVKGGARNIQDIYPLAPLQEGILFHHLMSSQGDPYLMWTQFACKRREQLDEFIKAFQLVVGRHDILRTAVFWEGLPEPVQVVLRTAALEVTELDLDGANGEISEQLKERFDPRHYRLDVSKAPMMEMYIARDEARNRWVAHYLFHHLVSDHITLEILQMEAFAFILGQGEGLPEPVPYRNYVAQARLGVSREEHEQYFNSLLADISEPAAPYGMTDIQGDGSGISESTLVVEEDLCRRLRKLARIQGVSAASLCHLAWALVVSRLSGKDDVVFGTVLFGRMQGGESSERIPGLFINTLPVRIKLDDDVRGCVRAVHTQLSELMRHEHAPLSLAQRCSGVAAPMPLFTALLNYRHNSAPPQAADGHGYGIFDGIEVLGLEERTNYPFTLSVDDYGEILGLTAQAAGGIDPAAVCGYMHTALASLARALEEEQPVPVNTLPVLSAEQRRRLLVEWNATQADYPRHMCIHELFEAQALATPGNTAVLFEQTALSYGELNEQANRLAHHLRALGVGPDSLVAICAKRLPAMVTGVLGVLKAGGAYVPMDPSYPAARLEYMLRDTAPVVVLKAGVSGEIEALLAGVCKSSPVLDLEADAGDWSARQAGNLAPASIGLTSRHLAYVIYTSGSTGMPKGVMIEHAGVMNYLWWASRNYTSVNGSLVSSSLSFDATVTSLLTPLTYGAPIRLIPEQQEVEALLKAVREPGCGLVKISPLLLNAVGEGLRAENSAAHVDMFIIGGEALTPATVKMWQGIQPGIRMVNEYGPTETVVGCTVYDIPPLGDEPRNNVSIGRPVANTRIYILDAALQPVPEGVTGEIYIGGAGVGRGYLNRPELTAERFIPDPFSTESAARMYKSGDLGRYLPDGNIEFLGRNDFQIKIRGFRIELGEIEARLRQHPALRDAVVKAWEDADGEKRLAAYYLRQAGNTVVSAEDLRAYLLETLPDYMVPAAYMELAELPLTSNGKLDRAALPQPDGASFISRAYEEPVGEREEALAAIWREVLRVERVGRNDNFFELGGHSLLAVKLISHINKAGYPASVIDLFRQPTVKELALQISGIEDSGLERNYLPLRPQGGAKPLFLIHEILGLDSWMSTLTRYIDPEIPVYGLQAVPLGETPLRTMQGMAQRFIKIMHDIQPEGPYRVCGYSLGGSIAYEIARQLIGQDEEVEFVGIIDRAVLPSRIMATYPVPSPQQCLAEFLYNSNLSDGQRMALLQLEHKIDAMNFDEFIDTCKQLDLYGFFGGFDQTDIAQLGQRLAAHSHAGWHYVEQPLAASIDVFAAGEQLLQLPGDMSLLGWDTVMPLERISITRVPGNHYTLMEEPHVAVLGAKISEAIARAAGRRVEMPELRYDALLPVQSGLQEEIPVFCVPGAGDTIVGFCELAREIGTRRPCYGLQPRGLDGVLIPHTTVEAAAGFYLRQIMQAYPDGPLHVIGHSHGGWIAFELAQRLRAGGRDVRSLTLIDSEVPGARAGTEYTPLEVVQKLIKAFELAAGKTLNIDNSMLHPLDETDQITTLHRHLVRAGILPVTSKAGSLRGILRTFASALRSSYTPAGSYAGQLNLVLASNGRLDASADEQRLQEIIAGWKHWAPDLLYWRGPGNHMTILRQPYVCALAGWWLDCAGNPEPLIRAQRG